MCGVFEKARMACWAVVFSGHSVHWI